MSTLFFLSIRWQGSGVDEVGYDSETKQIRVRVDQKYYRPTEVDILLGDASKAKKILGWAPKIDFNSLVKEMVTEDIMSVKRNIHDKS